MSPYLEHQLSLQASRFTTIIRPRTRQLHIRLDPADIRHHCLTAAYLAYCQLGGSETTDHTSFPWTSPEYRTITLQILVRELRGRQSAEGDMERRNAPRRRGTTEWSSWQQAVTMAELGTAYTGHSRGDNGRSRGGDNLVDSLPGSRPGGKVPHGDFGGEEDLLVAMEREEWCGELLQQLAGILSPQEREWLIRRHCLEHDQYQLAEDLRDREPERYAGPEGLRRAVRRVNTAISRAREKARQALGDRWARRARDLVAA